MPTNCTDCDHYLFVQVRVGRCAWQHSALCDLRPDVGNVLPGTRLAPWQATAIVDLTPPAWCPLRQEAAQ